MRWCLVKAIKIILHIAIRTILAECKKKMTDIYLIKNHYHTQYRDSLRIYDLL